MTGQEKDDISIQVTA